LNKPQDTILRELTTRWADSYRREHLNRTDTATIRSEPRTAFEFILERAFARAGGEQAGYGEIALDALKRSCKRNGDYQKLMASPDAGTTIWNDFQRICKTQNKRPYIAMNRSLIIGLTHLAKTSPHANPALKFEELIRKGKLTEGFLRLFRIKGIKEKIARFLLRDLVSALELEDTVAERDLQFLQPVDVWVRKTATYLWPPLKGAPDWLIAQFITEKCLEHQVSSIRFNQGAWRFGSDQVEESKLLPVALDKMARKRIP
jgi:hypothetical protein